MIPGEMIVSDGEIELNADRPTVRLLVANTGDRPIQVGSHYHFYETNEALEFDREQSSECGWISPQVQQSGLNRETKGKFN